MGARYGAREQKGGGKRERDIAPWRIRNCRERTNERRNERTYGRPPHSRPYLIPHLDLLAFGKLMVTRSGRTMLHAVVERKTAIRYLSAPVNDPT